MGILIYIYELLTCMIPAGLMILFQKKNQDPSLYGKRIIGLLIFALYLFAVFHITGVSTVYHIIRTGIEIHPAHINLIPFSVKGSDFVSCLLNIGLFIPLGILLPLLWPTKREFLFVLLFGFSFSLLIEISQLFNQRSTDVDDLIMNFLGAIIGFGIYWLFRHFLKKERPIGSSENIARGAIFVLIIFLFHYLTFNELFAAKLIYSF